MSASDGHWVHSFARALMLSGYESFERLLDKLPAAIETPLRREIRPLRDLFLRERKAHICFVGDEAAPLRPLLSEILMAPMGEPFERAFRTAAWTSLGGRGREISVLIVRATDHKCIERASASLSTHTPDAILLTGSRHSNAQLIASAVAALLPHLIEPEASVPVTAAWVTEEGEPGDAVAGVNAAIAEFGGISRRFIGSFPVHLTFRLRQDGLLENPAQRRRDPSLETFLGVLASEMHDNAKLSFARGTMSLRARLRLAEILTRAATTLSGIIGSQPVPLADLPLLTSLQIALVAAIVKVSGRNLDARLMAEFTAAVGWSIAASGAFRGLTRFGLKMLPGWGHVLSGGVAAAGTHVLGRSAAAFFIEEASP